ncbi:MAG: hypothetical protein H0V93_05925 [Euzebyales bacterium]|jgi:hypothetical protein|nr:hypothetical protein [Euzebyales bacterium]
MPPGDLAGGCRRLRQMLRHGAHALDDQPVGVTIPGDHAAPQQRGQRSEHVALPLPGCRGQLGRRRGSERDQSRHRQPVRVQHELEELQGFHAAVVPGPLRDYGAYRFCAERAPVTDTGSRLEALDEEDVRPPDGDRCGEESGVVRCEIEWPILEARSAGRWQVEVAKSEGPSATVDVTLVFVPVSGPECHIRTTGLQPGRSCC